MNLDTTGEVLAAISMSGYTLLFNTKDMSILGTFWHLPNLNRADFRNAIGIDTKLRKQLEIHSAILDSGEI